MMVNADAACPCGGYGSATTYGACCGPFVVDGELPATCEQLMRSRYTAFVVQDAEHLWRTWHPRTRPVSIGDLGGTRWRGLRILETEAGGRNDDTGVVEFAATYADGSGHEQRLHERSRFARRAGRWFYVDGAELA